MPLLTADPAPAWVLAFQIGCVIALAVGLIWSCVKCWKDRDHE